MPTAGTYQLEILITRPFTNDLAAANSTPEQFLDNVSISGTPVPEPSTFALGTLGAAGLALARFKKSAHGGR
ncbi:MAG: PEP-CTERM sorting domain-containing protein [Bryobacteraceae bacterium]